jgi:predicted DNA-binding transcriptional regulator AlpA
MTLLNRTDTCRLLGGISASTLYRNIATGRYPKPVKVGPNSSRWLLDEVQAALAEMIGGAAMSEVEEVAARINAVVKEIEATKSKRDGTKFEAKAAFDAGQEAVGKLDKLMLDQAYEAGALDTGLRRWSAMVTLCRC